MVCGEDYQGFKREKEIGFRQKHKCELRGDIISSGDIHMEAPVCRRIAAIRYVCSAVLPFKSITAISGSLQNQ